MPGRPGPPRRDEQVAGTDPVHRPVILRHLDLALELEERGYDWLEPAAAAGGV